MQKFFSNKVLLITILALCPILHVSGQSRHVVLQGSEKNYRVALNSDITNIKWEVFADADYTQAAKNWQVELKQGENEKNNEVYIKWLAQGEFYLMVTMIGNNGCPNKKSWLFNVEPAVTFTAFAYCDNKNASFRWEANLKEHKCDSITLTLFDTNGNLIQNIGKTALSGSMLWPEETKSDENSQDIYANISLSAHFDDIPETEDISVSLSRPNCTANMLVAVNDNIDVWHYVETTIDILNNDYDTGGTIDPSSLQIISNTNNGILTTNVDGSVNYKPNMCFFETDSFSYCISNTEQSQSNIATVYIKVVINPASDTDNDGILDIDEDIVGSGNLCNTDTDMDGNPNFNDPDDDGDGIATIDEPGDLDENGIPDYLEVWHSTAVNDYAETGIDIPIWISVLENDSSTMVAASLHIDINSENGYSYINTGSHDLNYSPDFDYMGKDSLYYIVCDHYGTCDTAKVVITVEDLVLAPEVFTPNNDGYNESFIIENLEHYPDNHLVIFNRWGNKVYEKTNYNNDWTGHSNVKYKLGDNPLPVGVYYYVLKYANNRIKQGGVYLER